MKELKNKRLNIKPDTEKGQIVSRFQTINSFQYNSEAIVKLRKYPGNCNRDSVNLLLKKYNSSDSRLNLKGNFKKEWKGFPYQT